MNFDEWARTVPKEITDDALWNVRAYRLALFAADIGWKDVTTLFSDRRTIALANQLYDAIGSIGANISEGYSRSSGKDRARFYEYSLGSARESRTWYFDGRHILRDSVANHRLRLMTELIRLLLTMVPDQRTKSFHEDVVPYVVHPGESREEPDSTPLELLQNVPFAAA
jgi:four helix bundle protein